MLTTMLLFTAATFAPLQDGMGAVETATATTPDNVRSFLKDVSDRFYDPRRHGLESVSFTLPIKDANIGHMADAQVAWSKGTEPKIDVDVLDIEMPPMLAQMGMTEEQFKASLPEQATTAAKDFLDRMLAEAIREIVEGGVGSMAGAEEGMVLVRLLRDPTPSDPIREHLFHVNEDSILTKDVVTIDSPMGEQQIEMGLEWAPARGGDKLLCTKQSLTVDFPGMGKMNLSNVSFGYRDVDGMQILEEITTEVNNPMAGKQTIVQRAGNMVVNGKRLDTPAGESEG